MTESDLIAKDDPVRVERARSLLRSAAKAVDAFEDAVRELVAMRAWTVLGYANLAVMWEAENGFKCPDYAKVIAVQALEIEGLNTNMGRRVQTQGHNGHTRATIAKHVGLPVQKSDTGERSNNVSTVLKQLSSGVPANKVLTNGNFRNAVENIRRHGDLPSRPTSRRTGKTPDELVHESFYLVRRSADAVGEIARQASTTKAEIYRQAVAEYLQRHNVSTHFGHAPNGAQPEPGGGENR